MRTSLMPLVNYIRLACTTLFFTVTACVGCSGGAPSGRGAASISNPNNNLSGDLWIAATGSRFSFDTGFITKLSEGQIYPSDDGREYVELIDDFRTEPDIGCIGIVADVDQINIANTASGQTQSSFDKAMTLSGPVKMSPDGTNIGIFTTDTEVCDDEFFSRLTIFSRTGDQLIQSERGIVSFDWLPDNRLVFFVDIGDGQFEMAVEAERNTLRYRVVATLDNIGQPARIDLSPDGSKLLIKAVTDRNSFLSGVSYREASIYTINIDGSDLQQIICTTRAEVPRVNQPLWSPDGNSIVVTENYTSGAQASFYGWDEVTTIVAEVSTIPVNRENVTYVISAGGGYVALPPDTFSESVKPIIGADSNGVFSVIGFKPLRSMAWTPRNN